MFFLHEVQDTIRVLPHLFVGDRDEVLTDLIEQKYANKVLVGKGLCIALFDFISIGDSYIYPGDGAAHAELLFRLIIFAPFVGEILEGTIASSGPDGIAISLGFFEDIKIPPFHLQQPSKYNESEKLWVWKYNGEEDDGGGGVEENAFIMDLHQTVRFKVIAVKFHQVAVDTVEKARIITCEKDRKSADDAAKSNKASEEDTAAMQVIATINQDGLGIKSWWD